MIGLEQINALIRQLLPTGRAFKMPFSGWGDSLYQAIALGKNQTAADLCAILNSILPDNANFTTDDASDWERRLGIYYPTASLVPLPDRMAAIARKMNHPGTIPARQNYLYMQGQLQAAGFNVFVYENIVPCQDPITLSGGIGVLATEHGDALEHGDAQHGGVYGDIVANYIDLAIDQQFYIGSDLSATFFIGGPTLGSFAAVPTARMQEFRQLILKLKAVQNIAYLFIVYI